MIENKWHLQADEEWAAKGVVQKYTFILVQWDGDAHMYLLSVENKTKQFQSQINTITSFRTRNVSIMVLDC